MKGEAHGRRRRVRSRDLARAGLAKHRHEAVVCAGRHQPGANRFIDGVDAIAVAPMRNGPIDTWSGWAEAAVRPAPGSAIDPTGDLSRGAAADPGRGCCQGRRHR